MKHTASLEIQVGLTGGSTVVSRSESMCIGILQFLCGTAEVTTEVKETKIKIVHVIVASEKSDYEGLSLLHTCIGTVIQTNAPPAYMIQEIPFQSAFLASNQKR